jgi:mono/diheme cytochrome c family protein
MAEAVEHSLQYLPETDLQAIAVYLRSVPAIADEQQSRPRDSWGNATQDYLDRRGDGNSPQDGAALFNGNCATCHGAEGAGIGKGFHAYPSLFNHGSTGAAEGNNLVSAILGGVHRDMQQGEILMPSFASELSDSQIAQLSNYVSKQFGNPAAANVSAEQVQKLRADAGLPQPPTVLQGDKP